MKKTIKLYYQIAKEHFSGFLELKFKNQEPGIGSQKSREIWRLGNYVNDSKIFMLAWKGCSWVSATLYFCKSFFYTDPQVSTLYHKLMIVL